jgi:hypothetical protein
MNRIAIIMLMSIAWFALSNHCLLGAASAGVAAAPNECPMHMKSSGNAPVKDDNNRGAMPCCKTLRAVMTAKLSVVANTLDFVLREYFLAAILPEILQSSRGLLALDTGPPGALSFSESVLQRSILAHAPPRFV